MEADLGAQNHTETRKLQNHGFIFDMKLFFISFLQSGNHVPVLLQIFAGASLE